jgi:hypothetical protein
MQSAAFHIGLLSEVSVTDVATALILRSRKVKLTCKVASVLASAAATVVVEPCGLSSPGTKTSVQPSTTMGNAVVVKATDQWSLWHSDAPML